MCRGLGGVSVAFDLVSRLMEVRAGVRVVLARLRAGGRVARVDCLPWSRVAKTKTADWLKWAGEHDANLTQHEPKIARLGPRVESIV